ncbi:MAG: exodeoxyribonuclease VII small subunit [Acidimicrobiia bacterium]
MTDDVVGYAEAMAELEGILDELERDDLDVDLLADHVKRASELIALCRSRIARAQADVDQIVVDLESFALTNGGGASSSIQDDDDDDD